MAIRQPDIDCVITARLDFRPQKDGDEAGVAIYLSGRGYYSFSKKCEFLYSINDGEYLRAGTIPVLTREDAGKCFTGTLIGLYAQGDAETEALAEVYSFAARPESSQAASSHTPASTSKVPATFSRP